jgi:hypothetical protein
MFRFLCSGIGERYSTGLTDFRVFGLSFAEYEIMNTFLIPVQQRWGKCSPVDFHQEWGNNYLVISNGKWGNGSMFIIYQEWGKGIVPSISWENDKFNPLLHAQWRLKINKIRRWFPGSCWTGTEEMILGFGWTENEQSICRFLLSRKLGDGTLVPTEEMIARKWGNVPKFLCRKWGDIFDILFKSSENEEMDPWFRMTGYEERWWSLQLTACDRILPLSRILCSPFHHTAGTVLSLYFFILLDIYMK